jgi:hypothetical protein
MGREVSVNSSFVKLLAIYQSHKELPLPAFAALLCGCAIIPQGLQIDLFELHRRTMRSGVSLFQATQHALIMAS